MGAILDDPLALSYEDVKDDGACVVHNANMCQGGLVAFDADTHHFAVNRDTFSGAAEDEMTQR